jgi:Galactose oxidase, central domain
MMTGKTLGMLVLVALLLGATTPALAQYCAPASGDLASMPAALSGASATLFNTNGPATDQFIIVGGYNPATEEASNAVYRYDVATNSWSTGAPMPTARYGACTSGYMPQTGTICYMGGRINPGDQIFTDVVECYDPVANNWSTYPPLPHRMGGSACSNWNGIIYVAGGWDWWNDYTNTELYWLDTAMPTGWNTCTSPPFFSNNGYARYNAVWAAGTGWSEYMGLSQGEVGPSLAKYDPWSGDWTPLATSPVTRGEACSGTYSQQIFQVGGINPATYQIQSGATYWDYPTGAWYPYEPGLGTPRAGAGCAQDSYGDIYLFGGSIPHPQIPDQYLDVDYTTRYSPCGPSIYSLDPSTVPFGAYTQVTIYGRNFSAGATFGVYGDASTGWGSHAFPQATAMDSETAVARVSGEWVAGNYDVWVQNKQQGGPAGLRGDGRGLLYITVVTTTTYPPTTTTTTFIPTTTTFVETTTTTTTYIEPTTTTTTTTYVETTTTTTTYIEPTTTTTTYVETTTTTTTYIEPTTTTIETTTTTYIPPTTTTTTYVETTTTTYIPPTTTTTTYVETTTTTYIPPTTTTTTYVETTTTTYIPPTTTTTTYVETTTTTHIPPTTTTTTTYDETTTTFDETTTTFDETTTTTIPGDDDTDDDDDSGGFMAGLDFDFPITLAPQQTYDFEFTVKNTTAMSDLRRWVQQIELFMPNPEYIISGGDVASPDALHDGEWISSLVHGENHYGSVLPGIRWRYRGYLTTGYFKEAKEAEAKSYAQSHNQKDDDVDDDTEDDDDPGEEVGDIDEGEQLSGFAFRATTDPTGGDGFGWAIWGDDGSLVTGTACITPNCLDEDEPDVDDDDDDDDDDDEACGCP